VVASLVCLSIHTALAATPLDSVCYSPDTSASFGTTTIHDENAATDDLAGGVTLNALGAIPDDTDLDAYHERSSDDRLLSFDTTVELPGGVVAERGDVVRYDGITYSIEFDASVEGVPDGADLDALTTADGILVLSFDVTVELDGVTYHDEDLVSSFGGGSFSQFFDGSSAGLTSELAVDALHYIECNGHTLISLDGSGTVGGVVFDDEDVLEYDPGIGSWELVYDGSAAQPSWSAADLDALHATVDPGPGPPSVFGQTVLAAANKTDYFWNNPVEFVGARGDFVFSTDVGDYSVDAQASGNGTMISDGDEPGPDIGFWYLFRRGGCEQQSWQTTLGAELGRDPQLP
jgi:hypothetical protein